MSVLRGGEGRRTREGVHQLTTGKALLKRRGSAVRQGERVGHAHCVGPIEGHGLGARDGRDGPGLGGWIGIGIDRGIAIAGLADRLAVEQERRIGNEGCVVAVLAHDVGDYLDGGADSIPWYPE